MLEMMIGPVQVVLLVLGIVEAAKRFGVNGKASEALALGIGVVLFGVASAIEAGLIPDAAVMYIIIAARAIAGALAATGYYDLGKKVLRQAAASIAGVPRVMRK